MKIFTDLFVAMQVQARTMFRRDLMSPRFYFRKLTRLRYAKSIYVFFQTKLPYLFPLPRMPYVISIEVSGVCNLSCIMCPYSTYAGPKGLMNMDLYRKLIDQAAEQGVLTVRFVGLGETLLHPQFIEMLRMAKARNLYTDLSTNGTKLTREYSEALLATGIDEIGFSLDAADASEFERLRKGAKYDDLMKRIDIFLAVCKEWKLQEKKTPITYARMVIIDPKTISQFSDAWTGRVDSLQFNKVRWYPNTQLTNDLAKVMPDSDSSPTSVPRQRKVRCRLIRSYMTINWDGKVRLCNQSNTLIGDATASTLVDIWHSTTISSVRKRHLNYKGCSIKSCRECPYMEPMLKTYNETHPIEQLFDA